MARRLRIGVFTNVLAHPPSGIGWHVIRLLEALAELDPPHDFFLFHRTPWSGRTTRDGFFCPAHARFTNVGVPAPDFFYRRYFRVFDRLLLPRAIRRHRLDVFHGPNHYLPARAGVPQIVTFHDIAEVTRAAELGTDGEAKRKDVLRAVGRADALIALSGVTRDDLAGLGCPADKMRVIHQGANLTLDGPPSSAAVANAREKFGLGGRYVLFVGSLVPRKNLATLVRAFAAFRAAGGEPVQLVLAGADDTAEAARLRTLVAELGIGGDVVFTGYIDNELLAGLYGGAAVFVLPSLYEGFGMVVLEAMAARVPVIASRAGSLAEVVGDAGLLIDPADVEGFTTAIAGVLGRAELAEGLVAKGLDRLRHFSWRATAEATLALYEEVARA